MIKKALRNFLAKRTIGSKLRNYSMNTFSSYDLFKKIRTDAEAKRDLENRPHEVTYFHKVDDPYSHLTIQYIDKIKSSYDVVLKPLLVGDENPETIHEPNLYNAYCLEDAKRIAPYYGIEFQPISYPKKELVDLSNAILTSVENDKFIEISQEVSNALWLSLIHI